MANKKNNQPRKRSPWRACLAAFLLCVLLSFGLYMHLQAAIVHVRPAVIELDDLPAAFEGTTILYASDIDLSGQRQGRWCRKMFSKLQALQPDILILGGDYTSPGLLERLNGGSEGACEKVFAQLYDFQAPMGKYAIGGDNDTDETALTESMAASGFGRIDVEPAVLEKNGERIVLVGLPEGDYNLQGFADRFSESSCVFCVTHSPENSIQIRTTEAKGGGRWCDLILCGHTHGGLVRLFGRNLLQLTDHEQSYLSGFYGDSKERMLVTSGMGSAGLGIRFGTQSEVWLLTLKRATPTEDVSRETMPSPTEAPEAAATTMPDAEETPTPTELAQVESTVEPIDFFEMPEEEFSEPME